MFENTCDIQDEKGSCTKKRCAFPKLCPKMENNHKSYTQLLKEVRHVDGVKKVFIGSGLRYDIVVNDEEHGGEFMDQLAYHHVSGQLKIGPEHISDKVLKSMGKPDNNTLSEFKRRFDKASKKAGKNQFLTYYIIASHPDCTAGDMHELRKFSEKELKIMPEQVQIFTPTPSTWSTMMYYTGKDWKKDRNVFVERDLKKKSYQKQALGKRKKK